MSVQKISSFKTFTELKGQQTAAKLHEEGKAKRADIVSKIGAALEELGVTSLQELDEEKRNSLISKIFNEDRAEDIEKKIVGMGKPEKEDPKKGENLTNEAIINEGTRSQIGKIDKAGKIVSTYVHYDGYPENMVPLLKNYKDSKSVDQLLKLGKAGISYLDKQIGDKSMDFSNPDKGVTLFYGRDRNEKGDMTTKADVKNVAKYLKDVSNKSGAEYAYLYDERDGKWYMADTYEDKELKPIAESFLNENSKALEGNAFGAAVVKAKKDGKKEFEVDGKKYKVKEDNSSELDAIDDVFEANYNVSRSAIGRMNGLVPIKEMKALLDCADGVIKDLHEEMFELDEIIGYIAFRIGDEFEGVYEGEERKTVELVEEGRSINKIQTEWTKVTNAMKATAAEWKAADGDAKETLLDTLKKMTAQKKALEAELEAVVSDKDKDLELAMESLNINEGFEVHYSDGIRAMKKFGNEKQAIDFAKDLIKNKKSLQFVDVFNAGSGFHSTSDTNAIVAFWGDGSYTDNVSKKDTKLAAKKMDESVLTEAKDFKNTKNFIDFLEEIDGMSEAQIKKIMGKDYIDTPGGYAEDKEDYDDIEDYMISNMGRKEFEKLQDWWEANVQESVVTESHFKVGDKVKMSHGGSGVIVSLDKEDGAKDEKYYNVELPNGEMHKHAPNELTKESIVNEEDIKSDDQFKEYAMSVLKKAFGDDFDEVKAKEVADGILKKCDGDYGACIGMLTSSLGESLN